MNRHFHDVGGTPGGLGEFFVGLALAAGGGYWLTQQVQISGSIWSLYGYNSFGLSLLPFMLGVLLLFMDSKSMLGTILLYLGLLIILAGILMNLRLYFQPTSLFNTLLMLGMLAGGVGLILKSLKPHLDAAEKAKD